ncbi:MAG TPA: hypothetical protein VMS60_06540 [Solirubrobacterales bacterium]|nr:hypothetical protein [Solirubrobacterales bacterium]
MDLALAMTATQKGAVLLGISAIAAPIAGYLFHRSAQAWQSFGKGPLSIEAEGMPPSRGAAAAAPLDPAVQAAEVRQMLEAKAERLKRHGKPPIDVEAEAARLLAAEGTPARDRGAEIDAELRAEVRQLVVSRNERRMRRGQEPLDVETETDRQLADFVGSD